MLIHTLNIWKNFTLSVNCLRKSSFISIMEISAIKYTTNKVCFVYRIIFQIANTSAIVFTNLNLNSNNIYIIFVFQLKPEEYSNTKLNRAHYRRRQIQVDWKINCDFSFHLLCMTLYMSYFTELLSGVLESNPMGGKLASYLSKHYRKTHEFISSKMRK